MNRKERIIELATQIGEMRKVLDKLEGELDALLPSENEPSQKKKPIEFVQKGDVISGSIPHRILEIVNTAQPDRIFDDQEFSELGRIQSVRSSLHRMVSSGLIEKVARGKYRAVIKNRNMDENELEK